MEFEADKGKNRNVGEKKAVAERDEEVFYTIKLNKPKHESGRTKSDKEDGRKLLQAEEQEAKEREKKA